VDGFDCDVNLPDGLVEVDKGLHTISRGVLLELRFLLTKLNDFLIESTFVEDFFTDEGSPELGGFGKSVDGVNDHLGFGSTSGGGTGIGG